MSLLLGDQLAIVPEYQGRVRVPERQGGPRRILVHGQMVAGERVSHPVGFPAHAHCLAEPFPHPAAIRWQDRAVCLLVREQPRDQVRTQVDDTPVGRLCGLAVQCGSRSR